MGADKEKASIVRKSNAIARARWAPDSIWEPRLVALLASKVRPDDTDFQTYDLPIVEIIGSNPSGRDYQQFERAIDKAVDKVMARIITIWNDDGWKKYPLFSSCELSRKKGTLTIGIHPDLKEHFLHLKQYVKFNLIDFMLLPSIYSQRLFEILKSWSNKREVILEVSQLHEMLESPDSSKSNFAEFKRRVLDKAYIDINKHTTLKYDWEPIKTGRTITKVKFKFIHKSAKNTQQLSIPQPLSEAEKQKSPYYHFRQFEQSFTNRENRSEAAHLFKELYEAGIAPTIGDIPPDNTLSVLEFLKQWQAGKMEIKNND